MTRALLLVLLGTVTAGPAAAQYRGPRSAHHLFSAAVRGARALWLNPAALGTADEASLMLEVMVERDPADDFPLSQYTIGFNSRGFSFGYRRDAFHVLVAPDDSVVSLGGNTWRLGFGRGTGALAVGAAVSIYSGTNTTQDVDIGIRYRIAEGLDLAVGLEHLGQPIVRDSSLRFASVAGLSWTTLGGFVGLDAEIRAQDRAVGNGYLLGYRTGLRLQTPGALPFALTGVLELDDGFDLRRVLVGLAVGADYLGSLVGGGRESGSNSLTSLSLLGQASRRFR